jgi:hypothetical protein
VVLTVTLSVTAYAVGLARPPPALAVAIAWTPLPALQPLTTTAILPGEENDGNRMSDAIEVYADEVINKTINNEKHASTKMMV